MRFVVDECVGPTVARWLRDNGHDIVSVFEVARGSTDEAILAWAFREDRILITADKDFGDLILRDRHPHRGVILPRLDDETAANIIRILAELLVLHDEELDRHFAVVTDTTVRVNRDLA